MNDKSLLFTLGNVKVKEKTQYFMINESVDECVNKRSQELYDLLYEKFNITYWACGKCSRKVY